MKKIILTLISCILTACGGGGSDNNSSSSDFESTNNTTSIIGMPITSGTGNGSNNTNNIALNQIPVTVSTGPQNNYLNGLFGSITLCNSANICTTVNNVIFDTGSVGVRIVKSALPSGFLTADSDGNGGTYSTCGVFASGYTWGDVSSAIVKLGGLTSSQKIPIHIIGQSNYSVPSSCSSGNGNSINTVSSLGANGIVGIGLFKYDCGTTCVNYKTTSYFSCKNNVCNSTKIPLTSQLLNPIAAMPAPYNNGNIISLPTIPSTGAKNVNGYIYLGIGNTTNNTFSAKSVINTDNNGYINITMNGKSFPQSLIDSGTNIYGITDSSIPLCSQSGITDYFCPSSTYTLSIILSNIEKNQNSIVKLTIDNAYNLFQTNNNAFYNIAYNFSASSLSIDLGLTFFFGKNIATGIEGTSSNIGNGTYFAF